MKTDWNLHCHGPDGASSISIEYNCPKNKSPNKEIEAHALLPLKSL